jgi:predicted transcriptional regulator of viral defense system
MRKGNQEAQSVEKHYWEVGELQIEYITIQPDHNYGVESVWVDQIFQVPMTDRERTVLDLCIAPRYFGGMTEVLGILEEHWHTLDIPRLVAYAMQYGKAVVAKRVGWTLEAIGGPPALLEPLLQLPATSYGLIDPSRPFAGRYDARWKLRNNLLS